MMEEPDFINPSPAHAVDLDKFFQRLDRGLTVNLINTPRDDLEVCRTDMVVGPDLEHNAYRNFDFLPVFEGDEIVGLLDRVQALTRKSDHGRPVKEVMAPLGEPNLIAARAGVRDFIRSADTSPARLVIDGTRVSGIVTIADLQKLPVRVALFSLITHLELLITEYVSNSLHQNDDPFSFLSDGRAQKARERWENLEKDQVALDKITSLELADKRELVAQLQPLNIGRDRIRRELRRVERLRNQIAHSSRYVGTRGEATRSIHAIQLAEKWIERLRGVVEPERRTEAT